MFVASHGQGLTETADPVAAHLGSAAVGVPELHHDVDGFTVGTRLSGGWARSDDEAIGTESAPTIAKRTSEHCVAVERTIDLLECDEEIVAETMVFGESHQAESSSDSMRIVSAFS
jgi:hypothetical protein